MTKKILITLILGVFLAVGILITAQDAAKTETAADNKIEFNAVEDEANRDKKGTAEESLYKITLDTFERAGEWRAGIPIEYGLVNVKEIQGAPMELGKLEPQKVKMPPKYGKADSSGKAAPYFEEETDEHKQVMGVKVSFMHRAHSWVKIEPPTPINLEGMVKGFEMWVAGRNKRHKLYIVIKDFYNKERYLEVGELNFIGWKKMNIQIPYTVVQEDFRYSTKRGMTFMGFMVKFHPEETSGHFYIYFDNISAELSRFLEENRDTDDILDSW